jgi:hypothetical protein
MPVEPRRPEVQWRVVPLARAGGTVLLMAGKKQTDATQNLPPGEPTQVLPKGTKTGLPKRRDVFALIDRLSGKKTKT